MTWLIVLIACTYCFTVAFTAKYKEESIDLREKNLADKEEFDSELLLLLEENSRLKEKVIKLKRSL